MEIDRQIISYINQIDLQNQLHKKIRKLKYLQDQLLIKTDTNLVKVLEERNPLWMESRQYNKIRLSLEMLRENDQVVNTENSQNGSRASGRGRLARTYPATEGGGF